MYSFSRICGPPGSNRRKGPPAAHPTPIPAHYGGWGCPWAGPPLLKLTRRADPGGIGTHAAGMSDRESLQHAGPFGPRQALCRIAERQRECPQAGRLPANLPAARHGGKTTPAGGASRPPDRNPGLSAHIEPSARAHQAEGAGCISPPAALAAVGLPGCRRAGGQSMKHPLLILQRGRLSRPCLRRSLSAAAFRGRHRIRHQSCKPELGAPGSNRPAACCGTP